jgi:glycosyltransferase involved in cell wall biosynthesis
MSRALQSVSEELIGIQSRQLTLSIVVPVLNEQDTVLAFITAVDAAFACFPADSPNVRVEYVFVNDGSTDATAMVLYEISKRDNRVRLVNLSRNFGKEAALSAGMRLAGGDAVIPMDVDLQDPPEVIGDMLRKWQSGAKVVNAKRTDRHSDTLMKRWSSSLFYKLINRISDYQIYENVGDFRLFDREAVDVLNSFEECSRFNKGLFSWIGFRTETVCFTRGHRVNGKSKWRPRKLWLLAIDGITSSTTLPLTIWTAVGLLVSFLAFAYAIFLIVYTIALGADVPGYASIMVSVLFLGGLNLMSLGLMGEYVGRIAKQVRGRPLYIIESKAGFEDGSTSI